MAQEVKIGKNVLENLTEGMYTDARIIYREYVQNAADAIDEGRRQGLFGETEPPKIVITIAAGKRSVAIEDNATGIRREQVAQILGTIADSTKTAGDMKGFRGIGRLGGIGYCDTLRFVTSYGGEDVQTVMTWDAKRARELLHDKDYHAPLDELVDEIVSFEEEDCAADRHFFRVELIGIRTTHDQLLDSDDIQQYISEVAPVDFSPRFLYKTELQSFIDAHEEIPDLDCYPIFLEDGSNYREVQKGYTTGIYKIDENGNRHKEDDIRSIQTDIIRDAGGQAVAWLWYGISCFNGAISEKANPMVGLRLRQMNIMIGDRKTLSESPRFFKEPRGNAYFMGEVHILSKTMRPNGRRDYFVETPEVRDFEEAFREYSDKNLYKLYHEASKIRSNYKKIKGYHTAVKKLEEKEERGFVSHEEEEEVRKAVEAKKAAAEKARKDLEKFAKKAEAEKEKPTASVFANIKKANEETDKPVAADPESSKKRKEKKATATAVKPSGALLVDSLSGYGRKERKLITQIYGVIRDNLGFEEGQSLIDKIQKALMVHHES